MRKTKEELNKLCEKYKVDRLWSWSRFNCYKNSPYEYFLNYVLHKEPDRSESIYSAVGGAIHQILEDYYSNKIKQDDMINIFEDVWITMEIADLKFDRTNKEKDKNIREKYVYNLRHFLNNHKVKNEKMVLEQFITVMVGKYVFQGYIDVVRRSENGDYIIQDHKSSSIYKGEKAIKESGQLILYAEGLRQLGVPLEKIKICWNFLKYCSITTYLANGVDINIRDIERCKIGESLKANATMWLKKLGYKDDVDYYINALLTTNDISVLPKDVIDKYQVDDCYVYVDLTEEMIDELKNDIVSTLDEITEKEKMYKETLDNKLFWDSPEEVKAQSYYFSNLCGYSANLHLPYKQFLEELEREKNSNGSIFGCAKKEEVDEDLSWLESL